VLMTARGELTPPMILRDTFMTSSAVVVINEARFLAGHQKKVTNDSGRTMEIYLELLVYKNQTDPPEVRKQSSSYGWFEGKGVIRMRDSSLQGAIAGAVKKKLTRGTMEDITFEILDKKRVASGYNVTIKIISIQSVLLKPGKDGPERLVAGSTLDTFVSDAEIK
jgi:hypothetical protein